MGYGLPAAIGASVADGIKSVVCFEGDGSLQMNIQELQTVVHNHLPIKLIVLNNNGYHSIRQTQKNFFGDELFGCTAESGVSFPDTEKIAWAYGVGFTRCRRLDDITPCLEKMVESDDPFILEVMLDPDIPFAPRSSSKRLEDGRIVSRPLDDLAPFLSEEERMRNVITD
jgi:acetolactate synthase-1/2/3 large subunit